MTDQPMIWLASFPRSGNTFLRVLLYRTFYDPDGRSSASVEYAIPDIHRTQLRRDQLETAGHGTFAKTHYLPWKTPHLDRTAAVLHLLREERRALSSLNRWQGDEYAQAVLKMIGVESWRQHLDEWERMKSHVRYWQVIYGDLCRNPVEALAPALDAIGMPYELSALEHAARKTTKADLRRWAAEDRAAGRFSIFPDGKTGAAFIG